MDYSSFVAGLCVGIVIGILLVAAVGLALLLIAEDPDPWLPNEMPE